MRKAPSVEAFHYFESRAMRSQVWPSGPPNSDWTLPHNLGLSILSRVDSLLEGASAGFSFVGMNDSCNAMFNLTVVKKSSLTALFRATLLPP